MELAVPGMSPKAEKNRFHSVYSSSAPVVHTCNPSCSGGRNQENHSSKPARANNLRDLISKNPIRKKRAGGMVQVVDHLLCKHETSSSNPSDQTKRKTKN
jgi:hypothetical protein